MKLSEAIDRLQKIKDEHGDIWICCKMSGKDQIFEGDAIVDITFLRYSGAPPENPNHLAAALLWPLRFRE